MLALAVATLGCGPSQDATVSDDAGNASIRKVDTPKFAESRFYRDEDKFLPADEPRMVSASEATFLSDDDEVLGFLIDGKARAYGLQAVCYHHVINDKIGDQPLAVTY